MKKRTTGKRRAFAFAGLLSAALVLLAAFRFPAEASAESGPRKVRVGYYPLVNYQEYDAAAGEYRGYSYDYMIALAQYADWEYEFVPVDSYDDGLALLEQGGIDLLNNVQKTGDLEPKLYFSSLPSGESYTCLLVKPDNATVAYEDYQEFSSLTVGLDYLSGLNSGFVDYCKDNDCMPKLIYFRSAEEVQSALASGRIDAYIASSLNDTDMRTVAKFDTTSGFFATGKKNSDLLNELNRAMNALKTSDPYFEEKLYSKYHAKSAGQETVLTGAEKEYIASQPVVRVAYDPAWYPVSYRDESGKFKGALADLFALVSQKTGLEFEYVSSGTAEEALNSLSSGQVQVMAGFPYDYTWALLHHAKLTAPFLTLTMFSAYRSGEEREDPVAQPAGSYGQYYSEKILKEGTSFVNFRTAEDCLQAVLDGSAGSVLLDSYQLEYYQERAAYRNLSFKAVSGEDYRLSVAVSDTADPYVYSILSKTLASLGSEKIGAVFRETSLNSLPRSLWDIIYANPRAAGWLFAISGFLLAAMISVAVYTYSTRKKNQKLRDATNARSEFMSNISHDMRTPLNGVLGYTDLALKAEQPETVRNYLRKARASGESLLNLINDTLDISKMESGKYVLNPEKVRVDDLVNSIAAPIQAAADAKGVRLVISTERMFRGSVFLDPVNTQKIFMNLLANAVKFTPEGGTVWLTIESIEPQKDGCNCRITVRDTGIGISEDFLPKLYEPFSQEHAPESQKTVGTGLGLSIVKKMVDLMNGRITVESRKGAGTQFEVYLPVRRLENDPEETSEPKEVTRVLSGKKVLLCEDNEMNTEIAVMILKSEGIETVSAADGKIGTELFAASAPGEFSAILMDLRMPVMDGYAAAKRIRSMKRPDAETVPIIALSADIYPSDLQKCREAGMNGQASKPVDRKKLISELVRLCGK